MTSYHGGKQRIGKKIAEIIYDESTAIEEEEDFKIRGYCEPFCGMLGVYQHIPELFKDHKPKLKYKAGDQNKSLILMWKALQKGWKPPDICNKTEFTKLRNTSNPSAKKGFIGHQCSFGGKYFQGYAPRKANNVSNKVQDIAHDLYNVSFSNGLYTQFSNLKNYIIYCDPPYYKYNKYYDEHNRQLKFDHDVFWEWCRKMAENNIVFVSEYKAPKDFDYIKIKKTVTSYGKTGGKVVNHEKLFVL